VKTYNRKELLSFLAKIDEQLDEPTGIEIIGGAAALIAYGAHSPTRDIDSFRSIDEKIWEAASRVTPGIPLQQASIADPPYNYEDRRESLDLPFRNLTVVVPERHDLVLMKTIRAYRHDVDVIEEMHRACPLDLETLVERFDNEMAQAVVDPRNLRLNFLHVIERLFGSSNANRVGAKGRPKMKKRGSDMV
jgi:Nucleotidyltransferase of unknown function (DUF6036)